MFCKSRKLFNRLPVPVFEAAFLLGLVIVTLN